MQSHTPIRRSLVAMTVAALRRAPQNADMAPPASRQPVVLHAPSRFARVTTACAVAALFGLGLLAFGRVTGREFSASSFEQRDFTFYRIPWLHWQVTPVWHDDCQVELTAELQRNGLIDESLTAADWRVAWVRLVGSRRESDVAILTRYLDDDGLGSAWVKWTVDHPQLASHFWPTVQRAARLEAYLLIPDLFDLAGAADDPQEFQQRLDRSFRQLLAGLADDLTAAGDTQHAARLRQAEAELADNPQSAAD